MNAWSVRINFQAVLFSPFVLAVLPAIVLLYLLPLDFEKYEGEVLEEMFLGDNNELRSTVYVDLNGDGTSEIVYLGKRNDIEPSFYRIQVNSDNYAIKEEWIIKGRVIAHSPVLFQDTDRDGFSEVYFFTRIIDSVFLNKLDPIANPGLGIKSVFVDLIAPDRSTYDVNIFSLGFECYDNDSILDLTFILIGGYCRQPRQLYRYYNGIDSIEYSKKTGLGFYFTDPNLIFDSDADGKNEYIITTANYKNFSEIAYQTDISHIDTCAWVVGYDDDLSFLFEPIPLRNISFVPGFLLISGMPHFYYTERSFSNYPFEIVVRDWKGKIYKTFTFPAFVNNLTVVPSLSSINNPRIVVTDGNVLYHFDINGNLLRELPYKNVSTSGIIPIDVYGDEREEYVIQSTNGLYITDNSLLHSYFLPLQQTLLTPIRVSVISKEKQSGLISVNNNAYNYEIRFSENPVYPWRHPIWFAVYMSVVLLLWLTQLLQKKQTRQKYEAERQLMAFRFRALKNQVDPHFTLNALNSIAFMQEKGLQEKAGKFLLKISRMIHRTLENSDKIETTLEEELEFVRDYLDVQQMRFSNDFSYEILIEEDSLNDMSIPRHLVHTFAENALKHGLQQMNKPGRLVIHVYRKLKQVIIEVDDNGIGREEAANNKSLSTGKGLKILDELITLFEHLKNIQISYVMIDKKDENSMATGTKVLIKLLDHEG